MSETIRLGDVEITLTRKAVKHAHLSVHPPSGRVTLVAPQGTRGDVARAFAVTKLPWIREQQSRLRAQAREAPRRFVARETHHIWGRRYLLDVRYAVIKPTVVLDHRRITLTVRGQSHEQAQSPLAQRPPSLGGTIRVHQPGLVIPNVTRS